MNVLIIAWKFCRPVYNVSAYEFSLRAFVVYLAIGYYGLEEGGSHQLLVFVNYVNLLDENVNIIKKNTGTLIRR